jgi:hypothetical protein
MYYAYKDGVIVFKSNSCKKLNPRPMKRRTTFSAIGGYQPFLFCIGMYVVALFFSIFICSAIFYAVNPKPGIAGATKASSEKTAMVKTGGQQVLLTVAQ